MHITSKFFLQVCNKDVKHEYTAILNHLRVKHNITLTNYTQTYIKKDENGANEEANDDGAMDVDNEVDTDNHEDQFYVVCTDEN